MDDYYKSLHIVSTAERDAETNLFRACVIIEIEHTRREITEKVFDTRETRREESESVIRAVWAPIRNEREVEIGRVAPPEGCFHTEEEAERHGVEWAKKWMDDNIRPKP